MLCLSSSFSIPSVNVDLILKNVRKINNCFNLLPYVGTLNAVTYYPDKIVAGAADGVKYVASVLYVPGFLATPKGISQLLKI